MTYYSIFDSIFHKEKKESFQNTNNLTGTTPKDSLKICNNITYSKYERKHAFHVNHGAIEYGRLDFSEKYKTVDKVLNVEPIVNKTKIEKTIPS